MQLCQTVREFDQTYEEPERSCWCVLMRGVFKTRVLYVRWRAQSTLKRLICMIFAAVFMHTPIVFLEVNWIVAFWKLTFVAAAVRCT